MKLHLLLWPLACVQHETPSTIMATCQVIDFFLHILTVSQGKKNLSQGKKNLSHGKKILSQGKKILSQGKKNLSV
jgi:hypothetical protein